VSLRHALAIVALALLAGCGGRNIHRDLEPDPKVLTRGWTLSTHGAYDANDRGFEYSNAALFENTLIFGNASTGVTSIYPGLLRTRWKFPVENGVVSEILVDHKTVYFGGGDGFLYALNAETGKLSWKYPIKLTLVSRPAIAGGRLFVVGADDTIYALDAGTGRWLWSYKRRTPQTATIHAVSSPLIDGNEVIAGMSDGFLVAVSVEEGTLKWERKLQLSSKFTDVDASPTLVGDTIYEPSYDGALYALKRTGGDTVWRFDAGGARKVFAEGDTIYLPSSNGTFYALSRANAKVLWQFELDRGVPTQPIVTDRYVVFGSSHQYLYALDKATGQAVYRWNAGDGSGFSSNPVYDSSNGTFYLLSMAGNLYQFKMRPAGAKSPDLYRFDSGTVSSLSKPKPIR
jgi:outer membrane protein assembly factor BamB